MGGVVVLLDHVLDFEFKGTLLAKFFSSALLCFCSVEVLSLVVIDALLVDVANMLVPLRKGGLSSLQFWADLRDFVHLLQLFV
jgi:hypothetical protein